MQQESVEGTTKGGSIQLSTQSPSDAQQSVSGSEELTIEQAFARLQQILSNMDQEGISLEDSFHQYEEGMKLVKMCNSKIDRVEKKVQMMNSDGTTTDFRQQG